MMKRVKVKKLSDGADGSNVRCRCTGSPVTLNAFLSSVRGLRENKDGKKFINFKREGADEFLKEITKITRTKFDTCRLEVLDEKTNKEAGANVKVVPLVETTPDGKEQFVLFPSKWTHGFDHKSDGKGKTKPCALSSILNYPDSLYLVEVSIKCFDIEVGQDQGKTIIWLKPFVNLTDITLIHASGDKPLDPDDEEAARAAERMTVRCEAISNYLSSSNSSSSSSSSNEDDTSHEPQRKKTKGV